MLMMSNQIREKFAIIAIIITAVACFNVVVTAFDLHNPLLPTVTSSARSDRKNSPRALILNTPLGRSNTERQIDFFCAKTNTITSRCNSIAKTRLLMGIGDFFKPRQGDFVKLESTESAFGPGPVILFFNVPDGISDEELTDMIEDGAPLASKTDGGVKYQRYTSKDLSGNLADGTVSEILELALSKNLDDGTGRQASLEEEYLVTLTENNNDTNDKHEDDFDYSIPIIYFSGVANTEMMQTYNIIAREIFDETGGLAACAKAVKPAMSKSFRQLLTEISGDHSDATGTATSDQ